MVMVEEVSVVGCRKAVQKTKGEGPGPEDMRAVMWRMKIHDRHLQRRTLSRRTQGRDPSQINRWDADPKTHANVSAA